MEIKSFVLYSTLCFIQLLLWSIDHLHQGRKKGFLFLLINLGQLLQLASCQSFAQLRSFQFLQAKVIQIKENIDITVKKNSNSTGCLPCNKPRKISEIIKPAKTTPFGIEGFSTDPFISSLPSYTLQSKHCLHVQLRILTNNAESMASLELLLRKFTISFPLDHRYYILNVHFSIWEMSSDQLRETSDALSYQRGLPTS